MPTLKSLTKPASSLRTKPVASLDAFNPQPVQMSAPMAPIPPIPPIGGAAAGGAYNPNAAAVTSAAAPTVASPVAMPKPGLNGQTTTSTTTNGWPQGNPFVNAGGGGNGVNDWKTFRFSNPADQGQYNFNQQMDAGNINGAYYGITNGAGRQGLMDAWNIHAAGDADKQMWNNLLNTYGGQGELMGAGYGGGSRAARSVSGLGMGDPNSFAKFAGATGSTPAAPGLPPGVPPPHGDTFPGTPAAPGPGVGLPGLGQQDYSQPLTDVSQFLDPSMAFRMNEGLSAIENRAAGSGSYLSGQTLKDLTKYGQDMASQEYSNAFNRANSDRSFRYGVDTGDRDFAYNAQRDDRNFNYGAARDDRDFGYNAARDDRNFNNQNLKDLIGYGLEGQRGSAALQATLAALLSNNTMAAGNAQGAGTMGGSNSINSAIAQILAQVMGNRDVNRYGG